MMAMIERQFPVAAWSHETWLVVVRICHIAQLLYRDSVPADLDDELDRLATSLMNLIAVSRDEAIRALAQKPKFHLLLHAALFQLLFGPLKHTCATEREESRIGHTKDQIANSNRHATSCDMSKRYYEFDLIRHMTLGGFDPQHPHLGPVLGEGCIAALEANKHIRHLLGLPPIDDNSRAHGAHSKAVRSPTSRRPIKHAIEMLPGTLSIALQERANRERQFPQDGWEHWKAVTLSGQLVNAGAMVMRKVDGHDPVFYMFDGIVKQSHDEEGHTYAVVRLFTALLPSPNVRHHALGPRYGLAREVQPILIPPHLLTSVVDMWHACHELGCTVRRQNERTRSEREDVEGEMDVFVHVRPEQDIFVLNTHFRHDE